MQILRKAGIRYYMGILYKKKINKLNTNINKKMDIWVLNKLMITYRLLNKL